jgi:hypothetical protein
MLFPLLNKKLNAVLCFVKCKRSMFYCSTTLTSPFQFMRSNDPYVPRLHENKMFSVGFSNAFLTTPLTSSGSIRTVSSLCLGCPGYIYPQHTQQQGYTNPWRQTVFAPSIWGSSGCKLLRVTRLVPRIRKWLLNFWKSEHLSTMVYGCPQCESPTPVNHRPFVDFLLAHTDNITERLSCSERDGIQAGANDGSTTQYPQLLHSLRCKL